MTLKAVRKKNCGRSIFPLLWTIVEKIVSGGWRVLWLRFDMFIRGEIERGNGYDGERKCIEQATICPPSTPFIIALRTRGSLALVKSCSQGVDCWSNDIVSNEFVLKKIPLLFVIWFSFFICLWKSCCFWRSNFFVYWLDLVRMAIHRPYWCQNWWDMIINWQLIWAKGIYP